jgi:hypothetical protein
MEVVELKLNNKVIREIQGVVDLLELGLSRGECRSIDVVSLWAEYLSSILKMMEQQHFVLQKDVFYCIYCSTGSGSD